MLWKHRTRLEKKEKKKEGGKKYTGQNENTERTGLHNTDPDTEDTDMTEDTEETEKQLEDV